MSTRPHADLRLDFRDDGLVDLSLRGRDLETIDGIDNLVQALQMRLLTMQGDLARLGHPRYGSRVSTLIGEPLTRQNLELLRRYVKQALRSDPRVKTITSLVVTLVTGDPEAVDVSAVIEPDPRMLVGPAFEFGVILDVG
jgi:phage baseplate assembly protein W